MSTPAGFVDPDEAIRRLQDEATGATSGGDPDGTQPPEPQGTVGSGTSSNGTGSTGATSPSEIGQLIVVVGRLTEAVGVLIDQNRTASNLPDPELVAKVEEALASRGVQNASSEGKREAILVFLEAKYDLESSPALDLAVRSVLGTPVPAAAPSGGTDGATGTDNQQTHLRIAADLKSEASQVVLRRATGQPLLYLIQSLAQLDKGWAKLNEEEKNTIIAEVLDYMSGVAA